LGCEIRLNNALQPLRNFDGRGVCGFQSISKVLRQWVELVPLEGLMGLSGDAACEWATTKTWR
jgi:hypothetical protein